MKALDWSAQYMATQRVTIAIEGVEVVFYLPGFLCCWSSSMSIELVAYIAGTMIARRAHRIY
jgi:hypothetical protein